MRGRRRCSPTYRWTPPLTMPSCHPSPAKSSLFNLKQEEKEDVKKRGIQRDGDKGGDFTAAATIHGTPPPPATAVPFLDFAAPTYVSSSLPISIVKKKKKKRSRSFMKIEDFHHRHCTLLSCRFSWAIICGIWCNKSIETCAIWCDKKIILLSILCIVSNNQTTPFGCSD